MSALNHYRAPASGLVLDEPLVPLDPWRCRWFGHVLMARYKRAPADAIERVQHELGAQLYHTESFPSRNRPPSAFERVWCERCGCEWKREEQDK